MAVNPKESVVVAKANLPEKSRKYKKDGTLSKEL